MDTFFDAALGFPAVLFTILLVLVLVYWVAGQLGVIGDRLGALHQALVVDENGEVGGE